EQVKDAAQKIEREVGKVVSAANFNSMEQTVISGAKEAVEATKRALTAIGASKIVDLPVSAPFHSALMMPAARGLADVLAKIEVGPLSCPVITNVEAAPNSDASR